MSKPEENENIERQVTIESLQDAFYGILGVVAVGIFLFWAGTTVVSYFKVSPENLASYTRAISATRDALYLSSLDTSYSSEFTVYMNGSVEIFIPSSAYESIPFPLRPERVRAAGNTWCDSIDDLLLPSVAFRDVRSGKKLASHGCFWGGIRRTIWGD